MKSITDETVRRPTFPCGHFWFNSLDHVNRTASMTCLQDCLCINAQFLADPIKGDSSTQTIQVELPTPPSTIRPAPYPFRDPNWQSIESAYHTAAINDLTNKTRSYNLQAPELAKKPYFSLQRELNACFADVAPILANTIKERAVRPARSLVEPSGAGRAGLFDHFNKEGKSPRIHYSKAPHYGLKELWRDFWKRVD